MSDYTNQLMGNTSEQTPAFPMSDEKEWQSVVQQIHKGVLSEMQKIGSEKPLAEVRIDEISSKIYLKSIFTAPYGGYARINGLELSVGDVPIKVNVTLRETSGQQLAANLSLNRGDEQCLRTQVVLLRRDADTSAIKRSTVIGWRRKSMGYAGDFYKTFYSDEKPLVVFIEKIIPKINFSENGFDIKPEAKNDAPTDEEYGQSVAPPLLARCLDLILTSFYLKESFDGSGGLTNIGIPTIAEESEKTEKSQKYSSVKIREWAKAKGLEFQNVVYQKIAISINLGRNIIFTGPPGCGKTELAILLASNLRDKQSKVVTATPSWTTGDVIGRYFPTKDDRLTFVPGVFLDAISNEVNLVVDELNRANIDECFGELFTVLSGQSVDLPYMEQLSDGSSTQENFENEEWGVVRIEPSNFRGTTPEKRSLYRMRPDFRIFGTMNDSDRSALHQLSFAMLRRFDIIRIDPPSSDVLVIMLEAKKDIVRDIGTTFKINKSTNQDENIKNEIIRLMTELFAASNGLVGKNVVGVATMYNVFNYIQSGVCGVGEIRLDKGANGPDSARSFVGSVAALGVASTITPLLDALDEIGYKQAVQIIKKAFGEMPFSTLNQESNGAESVRTLDTNGKKISEFLNEEFLLSARGSIREEWLKELPVVPND